MDPRVARCIEGVDPGGVLLITDFDGTLAPIVPLPGQARALPGALEALEQLARRLGSVVILTGRSRTSLVSAMEDRPPEGVRILCNYGADDPRRPMATEIAAIARLSEEISALHGQLPNGVAIEEKGTSIALHTRGCSEPINALSQTATVMGPVARELDLDMQFGRDVVDIGIRFGGKAASVERLLKERSLKLAIMFGDDHSDLDAFDLLSDSKTRSLTVGVESDEVPGVAARCDLAVSSPADVVQILEDLVSEFPVAESRSESHSR